MKTETTEQNLNETSSKDSPQTTQETANAIIKRHVYAAMGVGIIPIPFVDFTAVAGVQLNLVRKLAIFYNVPFSKDMVKPLIGALIGGAAPASLGQQMFSALKAVPVFGHIVGGAGMVLVGGAATYAVGKVFNRHFAEGGTFLSFDPEGARAFYREMFDEGKKVAADLKTNHN